MGTILIIAEKPNVAKQLLQSPRFRGMQRVQGSKPFYGYFENQQYIITWARGHLYEVMNPGDHDESLKTFSFENLPIILPVKYKTIPSSMEQVKIINQLIHRNDVEAIVNACDNDKEGELLFREIYEESKTTKPLYRIWLSSYEIGEIEAAFNRLLDGNEFDSLADSARARQYLDHLLGDTITRASTVKFAKNKFLLSGGRVQLCLLNEIRNRELEVENFKPKKFYTLYTDTGFLAQYQTDEEYILNPQNLQELANRLKGNPLQVKETKDTETKRNAPNLFNATDFLKACIQKLGITAPQAKSILQSLYEEGFVSYPRSDARHLPTSMVDNVKDVMGAFLNITEYQTIAAEINVSSISEKHRSFNDEKVTSHYAIIPTKKPFPEGKKEIEKRVYDLIVKRFFSNFMQPAKYIVREISLIDPEENEFLAKEKVLIEKGYLAAYQDETNDNEQEKVVETFSLPVLSEGEKVTVNDCIIKSGTTRNPGYHTEASILTFMETAGRNLVEEEEIKELLKGKRIGTAATAESFIPKLMERNYIVVDKGKIKTTSLGASFIEAFPVEELKNPIYTAEMEESIAKIEKNELSLEKFIDEINTFAHKIVKEIGQAEGKTIAAIEQARNDDIEICSCSCGKGKIIDKGKFYGCTCYPECSVTFPKVVKEKTISGSQIEKLIKKGETDLIKGFSDSDGNSFEAVIFMENGQLKFKKYNYGKCPICKKGDISKRQSANGNDFYGCSQYKEGCTFSVPSIIKGKKLPEGQIKKLLQQRTTDFIQGFIGKEDKEFTARIAINQEGKLQMVFPTIEDKTIGKCPLCKGRVLIGKSYYLCENYKKSCEFLLYPVIAKKEIPPSQIQKLLEKNITDLIKGFHKNDGSGKFDAKLSYNVEKKQVVFVFEKKNKWKNVNKFKK